MGLLVNGQWQDKWYDTKASNGQFVRESAAFRGVLGSEAFPVEADRYHLYVSYACPWAHRTLIFRELKALQSLISVSVVHPYMMENGWEYRTDFEGATGDDVNAFQFHHQLYTATDPNYTGRVTVPVLWDKKQKCIVNNESAEIIRQFNTAFNGLTGNHEDYYPEDLRADIDAMNERIYHRVNNGVYKAGFATSQEAYEKAFDALFEELNALDQLLGSQRYLCGDRVTEADWRLFTTLVRFDEVYYSHFKCNQRHVWQYPNLFAYTCELFQMPGIQQTVRFDHIRHHYYHSQRSINPTGVVPMGPSIDFNMPHGRDGLSH